MKIFYGLGVFILGALGLFLLSLRVSGSFEGEKVGYEMMRQRMVSRQLMGRGIDDARVLEAMGRVARDQFVPDRLKSQAYDDGPLPIGYRQTISQPYIVAYMTQALEIDPEDRVLEIGTGSGYQAAVLAELAKEIYSVEIIEPLYLRAKNLLERLGYGNIELKLGNGWLGWRENAPFDKIIVTAASDEIPPNLVDQLKEGGRIVLPVGEEGYQNLIVGVKKNGNLEKSKAMGVRFVPLVKGRDEFGE